MIIDQTAQRCLYTSHDTTLQHTDSTPINRVAIRGTLRREGGSIVDGWLRLHKAVSRGVCVAVTIAFLHEAEGQR
jgi:hypothetical protein